MPKYLILIYFYVEFGFYFFIVVCFVFVLNAFSLLLFFFTI
jgi:hypothetical protein